MLASGRDVQLTHLLVLLAVGARLTNKHDVASHFASVARCASDGSTLFLLGLWSSERCRHWARPSGLFDLNGTTQITGVDGNYHGYYERSATSNPKALYIAEDSKGWLVH